MTTALVKISNFANIALTAPSQQMMCSLVLPTSYVARSDPEQLYHRLVTSSSCPSTFTTSTASKRSSPSSPLEPSTIVVHSSAATSSLIKVSRAAGPTASLWISSYASHSLEISSSSTLIQITCGWTHHGISRTFPIIPTIAHIVHVTLRNKTKTDAGKWLRTTKRRIR